MTADYRQLDDLAYAAGRPSTHATLKSEFADFRVDEELGFALSGAGEHLYLQLQKVDIGTTQVARHLAEVTGVPLRDVGYSGMKDRQGECTQWFSLKLPPAAESRLQHIEGDGLSVKAVQRNKKKLRIGSHKANHFALLLRHCIGPREEFEQRLTGIRQRGVPNYFGAQRFGHNMSNIDQVLALFRQAEASEDDSRRSAGRQRRGMLLSAARAYLFNQLLSERIANDNWQRYVAGDVLNLDGTQRFFAVAPQDWDQQLQSRLDSFDIHLTGPLPGRISSADRYVPQAQAADIEKAVLSKYPELVSGLIRQGLDADRRPLRFMASALSWRWLAPENTDSTGVEATTSSADPTASEDNILELNFQLPRGAYATSLLREVCIAQEPTRNNRH